MSAAVGATAQVTRLMTLVPLLERSDGLTLRQASDLLGVSVDRVLADLRVLWMCGLPGGMVDDLIAVNIEALATDEGFGSAIPDAVIHIDNAGPLTSPARLSPTEATALLAALGSMRLDATGPAVDVLDTVIGKIRAASAVAGGDDRPGLVEPGAGRRNTAEVAGAAAVESAIAGGVAVEFDYYVPSRDEKRQRTVDPWHLVDREGLLYLVGHCHAAGDRRTFRVDRMSDARSTERPATHPEQPSSAAEDFFDDATLPVATLRLGPGAHWVAEYYPTEAMRRVAPDVIEVDLRIGDERWLAALMRRLGTTAELLGPEVLVQSSQAAAAKALALYR